MSDDGDFLSVADTSTVAMVLCFGTIIFTASAMAAKSFLVGDYRALTAAITFSSQHRREDVMALENSFISIFMLLYHLTIFGLILMAAYILEHHPPFPHEERGNSDPDYLVFLVVLVIALAFGTVERNDGRQTERKLMKQQQANGYGQPRMLLDDASTIHDDVSTIASAMPSIATRRSARSGQSSRSGGARPGGARSGGARSGGARSGGANKRHNKASGSVASGGSRNSNNSNGSVEDVDLGGESGGTRKSSNFLDRLEEESLLPHENDMEIGGVKGTTMNDDSYKRDTSSSSKATKTTSLDLLNVHQTLEWKGLLSACFLVYQLTDAETLTLPGGLNPFYNASRVGASCFVFMTGFGHAMFFYTRNNFQWTRVMRVLFRMNITAFFLCLVLGRPYITYYACPLHSFAFLMTFAVMKINQMVNYTKYGLRMKLLILSGIIFTVWDMNIGFDLFFGAFYSRTAKADILNGPLWEWYYHSHMHHWVAFVGMLYAINYPVTSLLLEKMEALSDQQMALAKGTGAVFLLVALTFYATGPFATPTFAFDSTHSYFAFLPILSYIFFRNLSETCRQRHLHALKTLGKFTLETFIFHHHFFLADNGKSVLVLVPGYPKCNVLVTGLILLGVARTAHNLTSNLCGMLLPSDNQSRCIRSLGAIIASAAAFYCIAFTCQSLHMASATVITLAILLFGGCMYLLVVETTWVEFRNIGRQLSVDSREEQSLVGKASPPAIGALVILVLGISWFILSLAGASEGSVHLPQFCDEVANDGMWAPVSPCSEYQRGLDTRESGVGAYYGDCDSAASMVWGWKKTLPNAKCSFRSRGPKELLKHLSQRKVVFIGDLMVRNLFHALCRLLGDSSAGMFDVSVADHADIIKGIGDVKLEYKWAPLAFDQVSKLKDIRLKGNEGGKQPNVVIVGGGTMDRLHVWATDEDQESHKAAVQKLAKELEFATMSSIWCTPTTINTPALGNDEKRNQMNEMAISEVRKIYVDLDVESSADFVLDGPGFTKGRVAESYDGVLYPSNVYDAGIQIVANSFDWLVPISTDELDDSFVAPQTGSLSNPFLGLMMGCFGMIGLFFFDGYLGFSYLSSLFVRNKEKKRRHDYTQQNQLSMAMPNDLYEESFLPYHRRLKLPSSTTSKGLFTLKQGGKKSAESTESPGRAQGRESDILSLLDNDSLLNGGSSRGSRMSRRR